MNIRRYVGRRLKGGANRLLDAAVQIIKIALGVALGLAIFIIAAPVLTG